MGRILRDKHPVTGLVAALLLIALLVGSMAPFREEIGLLNVALVLLLASLLISAIWGLQVGLLVALIANLSFNFFFIEPLHTLTVQEPRNVIGLVAFLAVSAVGGTLLAAARTSEIKARRRQTEAEAVLALSRSLSREVEPYAALQTLCRELMQALRSSGISVLSRTDSEWVVLTGAGGAEAMRPPDPDERTMAEQAVASGATTGLGEGFVSRRPRRIVVPRGRDAAFPRSRRVALVPITLGSETRGVLRIDGPLGESPFGSDLAPLLSAVAGEAGVTLHRLELARAASHAAALSQADEMQRALMASISHDLMTPLAGIKAAISNLLDQRIQWSQDDIATFYATIDAQADRLNRVIGDILDLNRIESGDLVPDQTLLSADELLEVVQDATAYVAKGRKLTLSSTPGLFVLGDRALITQALVNLVENAVKYSIPDGEICLIATAGVNDTVRIVVEDEGPGIPPEDLPYVFQRYYRAESARRIRGSGLGLTIVKSFIELCGGSVAVESFEGGARFIVTLPGQPALVGSS